MLSKSSCISLASALPFLASLHLSSSTAVPAQKFPVMPRQTNSSNTGVSLPNTTKKFYANALCSPEQEQIEQVAWNDASRYAHALDSWHANGSYQAAMDMYMGNDSRGPLGDILEANILGAVNVHTLSTLPEKQRVFILCEEPVDLMTEIYPNQGCDGSGAIAYEFEDVGTYFENHYIVFCAPFYDQPTLSQALNLSRDGKPDRNQNSIDTYTDNRGDTYFHESLHLADLTTPLNHSIFDAADKAGDGQSIYGAWGVFHEARTQNTGGCIHTADAYTYAAAAILGQQTFDLAIPPIPGPDSTRTEKLVRFPRQTLPGGFKMSSLVRPYFPDPDTKDNHIAINDLDFGTSILTTQNATEQLASRSSTLKRLRGPRDGHRQLFPPMSEPECTSIDGFMKCHCRPGETYNCIPA